MPRRVYELDSIFLFYIYKYLLWIWSFIWFPLILGEGNWVKFWSVYRNGIFMGIIFFFGAVDARVFLIEIKSYRIIAGF